MVSQRHNQIMDKLWLRANNNPVCPNISEGCVYGDHFINEQMKWMASPISICNFRRELMIQSLFPKIIDKSREAKNTKWLKLTNPEGDLPGNLEMVRVRNAWYCAETSFSLKNGFFGNFSVMNNCAI